MRLRTLSLDSWAAVAVLVALVVTLAIFALRWLNDPNIWFDESGQYWLSRGLNHDSPIDAPLNWIGSGVLDGMTGFNLDPPGFTIFLGLTIGVLGSDAWALRLLPFAAFVGTFAVAYLLGRRALGLPRSISLALPSLALTGTIPLFYSTEIRAYSAELLLVTASLLTTAIAVRSRTLKSAVPFIVVIVLGMLASRYYFLVAAGSAALTYTLAVAVDADRRLRVRQGLAIVLAYAVVGLATAWSIGLFGPGSQWEYGQGYAQGQQSLRDPGYLAEVLRANFLEGPQRATGAFLALGLILVLWRGARRATRHASTPRPLWVLMWVLVVAYEAVAVALSAINDMPWDARGRWSIGLVAMAVASLLGLASMIKNATQKLPEAASRLTAPILAAVAVTASTAVAVTNLNTFERPEFRVLGSQLPALVESHVDPTLETQWAIDYWTWPGFRWLAKESGLWPERFGVEDALPVGDGVLTNANWPDVIPNLELCAPGKQTVIIHERWNENYNRRTMDITNWAQQQRCRVSQVPISESEMMLVLSPTG